MFSYQYIVFSGPALSPGCLTHHSTPTFPGAGAFDAVARQDGTYSAKKRRERKGKEREKDKEKDPPGGPGTGEAIGQRHLTFCSTVFF